MIVEHDVGLQKQMRWCLDRYELVFAPDRESAITKLRRYEPAVVLLDIDLPSAAHGSNAGFATFGDIVAFAPATRVVVLADPDDRSRALRAVAMGAHDVVARPFVAATLDTILQRAFALADLEREAHELEARRIAPVPLEGLLTRDPRMLDICRQIERFATVDVPVLLNGESGTGKETLARALHRLSSRRHAGFVAIDCAAFPEALSRVGPFADASDASGGAPPTPSASDDAAPWGTLFLDDVGELPPPLQARLARHLDRDAGGHARRRDGARTDVRVVCATRRDLRELVAQGRFRADLLDRLGETVVALPPLRERHGDAALLAHALARRTAERHRRRCPTLAEDAVDAIARHRWPGNVRQLSACVERAVVVTERATIHARDLRLAPGDDEAVLPNLRQARDEAERRAVLAVMARVDGNVARAASLLGISRPTLYGLLSRFGLR